MKNLFLLPLTALVILLSSSYGHAISLTFVPVTQSVTQGSIASVALNISALTTGAAPSLGAFDLNVNFNPSILSFNSVVFGGNPGVSDQLLLGPACTNALLCGSVAGSGTVEIFELSNASVANLNNLQVDTFILATLRFNTLAAAINSPLTFSNVILGDALGNPLSATLGTGSVTVTPRVTTPEPAGLLLLAFGLAVLGIWRRAKSFV
jgi:hypothetical protein